MEPKKSSRIRDWFSRLYMSTRECILAEHRPEMLEETVADLSYSLSVLSGRKDDIQQKIHDCNDIAVQHRRLSMQARTAFAKQQALSAARAQLSERNRLQNDLNRITNTMQLVRQQIDAVKNSHVDGLVVDAMRTYSMTASLQGLPERTEEINDLASNLQAQSEEVERFQQAMGSLSFGPSSASAFAEIDDNDLLLELDSLIEEDADIQKTRDLSDPLPIDEGETTHLIPSAFSLPPVPSTAKRATAATAPLIAASPSAQPLREQQTENEKWY